MQALALAIDITNLQAASSNPFLLMWEVFRSGGWVAAIAVLVLGLPVTFFHAWLSAKQLARLKSIRYVMLALDIPKGNEQTPKAVEAIFAHLHGIDKTFNLKEKYLQGQLMPQISFEIIGIEGQSQFLVRTPEDLRDLVEATIYAQYPDAAITEVVDYTEFVPDNFEEAGYDLWGSDLIPYKPDVYPIRTYPFFEHSLSQQLLDPMASLLELFGRLGPTEQIWLQLVITPTRSWWDRAMVEAKKIMGVKQKQKTILDTFPGQIAKDVYGIATASLLPEGMVQEEKQERPNFMALSTGEKSIIESIQIKASKLGWLTKFRLIYLGKPPYFSRAKGVSGAMGALKQFSTNDMNGFYPDPITKTVAAYFFVKRRLRAKKYRILKNYKRRSLQKKFQLKNFARQGAQPFILNTEELASVFHFPVLNVKAPMVQKTEAKRGEPPMTLPVEPLEEAAAVGMTAPQAPRGGPPPNLPT